MLTADLLPKPASSPLHYRTYCSDVDVHLLCFSISFNQQTVDLREDGETSVLVV